MIVRFFHIVRVFVHFLFNLIIKVTSYTNAVNFFVFFGAWFSIGYGIFIVTAVFPLVNLSFPLRNINLFYISIYMGIVVTAVHFILTGGLYRIGIRFFYRRFNILNENFISIDRLKDKNYSLKELKDIRDRLNELPEITVKNVTFYAFIFFVGGIIEVVLNINNTAMLVKYILFLPVAFVPAALLYRFSGFLISDHIVSYARYMVYNKIYLIDNSIEYIEARQNVFRMLVKLILFFVLDFIVLFLLLYAPICNISNKNLIITYLMFVIFFKGILMSLVFNRLYKSAIEVKRITAVIKDRKVALKDAVLFPIFNEFVISELFKNLNEAFKELIMSRHNFELEVEKRTEEINYLKNFLQNIIEVLPVGVLYTNENGIIEIINNEMSYIFGISDVVGKNIFNVVPKNIAESIQKTQDGIIKFGDKDLVVLAHGYYRVIKRRIGEPKKGFILAAVDITNEEIMLAEIKVTNDILTEKTQEALIASKAKSVFLANMSHEIRTPLNSIVGFVDILLNDEKLDRSVREKLEFIESSSYALLQLISDILDIAKIESGKIEVNNDVSNFVEFINEVANVVKGYFREKKNVDIIFDIDDKIPVEFKFDALRLKQILINLLSNSIKFTKKGYILLAVNMLEKKTAGIRLQFVVEDTGIGIPADKIEKVLQPFEQADKGTTKEYGGTGLGLTLSSKLISILGGELKIESQENIGSKFSFILNFQFRKKKNVKNFVREKVKDIKNLSVVFLDDNELNLKIYNEFCAIAGIKKYGVFSDYNKFYNDIMINDYDILFLDINMSIKDGVEIVRELRAKEKFNNKLFIAVSSISDMNQKKYHDAGFSDVLLKPILLNDFVKKIKSLVSADRSEISHTEENKKNLNVLVVEDIKMNQMVIANMLDLFVNKTDIADNGEEAVQMAVENKYDLIFMDLHMPIMDGFQATNMIREFDKNVRIIALTADGMQETVKKCLDAGMNEVVTKPIKIQDVKKVFNRMVEKKVILDGSKINWIENFMSKLHLKTDDIKDILLEFKGSFAAKLDELKKVIKGKNIKDFEEISHALKGEVRTLYHKELTELFTKINNAGKQGKIPHDIDELLGKVNVIWNRVKKDIDLFLKKT